MLQARVVFVLIVACGHCHSVFVVAHAAQQSTFMDSRRLGVGVNWLLIGCDLGWVVGDIWNPFGPQGTQDMAAKHDGHQRAYCTSCS